MSQAATETSPLLAPEEPCAPLPAASWFSPVRRLQLISFLMVTAMSMPNTSLLYVMGQMSCDGYYNDGKGEWTGPGDRCHVPDIESIAAASVAKMGTIQTVSGILSIFVTQPWIAKFGTKTGMLQVSIWSAIRMLTHVYAIHVGGSAGVTITLVAQLLCILGTPGGFMLATNSALMEMVPPEQRTAMFGVLGGAQMAGMGLGLLSGGAIYTYFGLTAPFAVAFVMLAMVVSLGLAIVPYVPPMHKRPGADGKIPPRPSALASLKLLGPTKDAHGRRSWTLTLLILGVFTSVLATGFVGLALQLAGQDMFLFEPNQSSLMLFGSMVVRTVFLMAIFPRIIAAGRKWLAPKIPVDEEDDAGSEGVGGDGEVASPVERTNAAFDIHFLRLSILMDAILTSSVSLVRKDWQLYLAAAVLPLASGTGPAAKGVVTELVGPEHKQEALSAIALVESVATVATVGLFGTVYAVLAKMGIPLMLFATNGAVALVAFAILVPVRLRPVLH